MRTSTEIRATTGATWPKRERRAPQADHDPGLGRRFEGSLRVAASAMDRQVSLLATHAATQENASTVGELIAAWAALVEELALGPSPDVRSCPVCGHLGMSAATLCGHCWTRLSPIPPRSERRGAEQS